MREIVVNELFAADLECIWNLFTDISKYPKYALFVKSAKVVTGMKKGGMWYDISTILWIPVRYDHYITEFVPGKKLEFTIYPITGGKIVQRFAFKKVVKATLITGGITVDLKWKVIDALLGDILEKRLRKMIAGTIQNVHISLKKQHSSH